MSQDFDEILGGGEGLLLVYKNTGNVAKEEHSYGVLNIETGTWEKPLTPGEALNNNFNRYKYYGNGIFLQAVPYITAGPMNRFI